MGEEQWYTNDKGNHKVLDYKGPIQAKDSHSN